MFDKIDYKTVRIAGRDVRLTINHRERSISARLNDGYPVEWRLTGYLSRHLAFGASVRLEYGGDEDMLAGLYLGPLRLYAGISNRLLGSILAAVKLGRRVTSLEAELGPGLGEMDGTSLRVRGHLWDDDYCSGPKSRGFSVDLFNLLGRLVRSEPQVLEEREVIVPLPEGGFTTKARLVERFASRPGWPFKLFHRWVEFRETPAVVPVRKSSSVQFYNAGGPWTGITGETIEDGIAELVRRILESRSQHGGKRWANGVPVIEKDERSYVVSVWQTIDGPEQETWRGEVMHGDVVRLHPSLDCALARHPLHGGIIVAATAAGATLRRGNEEGPLTTGALVFTADTISAGGYRWKIYSSPIGPAPTPTQQGSVNAFDILAAAKAAGLHGVNGGPAIGRVGRSPLQGLTAAHVLLAEQMDPQWFAANAELVEGARAVHPASTFDVETRQWIEPSTEEQEAILRSEQDAYERSRQWQASQTEQANVQEVLAELDTTPPGPTEEADGLAARERTLEVWMNHASTAVSAMSAVLGAGEPDLPPATPDTRPWLPAGPLVVTVIRGETRSLVRLPAGAARIGSHKDAEVRLLGAHTLSAQIEQENGAVWIHRRADNVAVDLLGLDIGERVRLREGAEVLIGQLYVLTFASAEKARQ